MAGRVAGKVAFITGAARGQGRSHALRLAQEGADIIAVDLCGQVGTVPYPMATEADLAETVKEVEALDRRIVATQADVRDYAGVKAALDDGVAQLGRLDIVCANAGIFSFGALADLDDKHMRFIRDSLLEVMPNPAEQAIAIEQMLGVADIEPPRSEPRPGGSSAAAGGAEDESRRPV